MLELCSGSQALPSRLAVDVGMIAGFRSGTATLGCVPTAFGPGFKMEKRGRINSSVTAPHSETRSRIICKTENSEARTGSYLESTLAKNRGRGSATLTSPLTMPEDLSLAESYRCALNKANYFGIISLQKKVGGTPGLK